MHQEDSTPAARKLVMALLIALYFSPLGVWVRREFRKAVGDKLVYSQLVFTLLHFKFLHCELRKGMVLERRMDAASYYVDSDGRNAYEDMYGERVVRPSWS